jgi:hypothetical protein
LPVASRLVRSIVFVATSMGLAIAAHLVGGGVAPPESVVLIACGVLAMFSFAVTGRERRMVFIGVSVVSTQLLLHVSFALAPLLVATGGPQNQTAIWARILFCHHGPHPITAAQVAAARATMGLSHTQLPASLTQTHGPGLLAALTASWWLLAMLAAHLVAAGVMAWWLRRGEKRAWHAIRQAAEVIRLRVLAVLAPLPTPEPARSTTTPTDCASRRCPRQLWARSVQRRGPPITD